MADKSTIQFMWTSTLPFLNSPRVFLSSYQKPRSFPIRKKSWPTIISVNLLCNQPKNITIYLYLPINMLIKSRFGLVKQWVWLLMTEKYKTEAMVYYFLFFFPNHCKKVFVMNKFYIHLRKNAMIHQKLYHDFGIPQADEKEVSHTQSKFHI